VRGQGHHGQHLERIGIGGASHSRDVGELCRNETNRGKHRNTAVLNLRSAHVREISLVGEAHRVEAHVANLRPAVELLFLGLQRFRQNNSQRH